MRRMGLNDLGIAERVQRALAASGFEAIIAVGADNVQYLSGARLPFLHGYPDRFAAVFWPRKGEPECICPVEWESTIRKLSWMKKIRSYAESENNTAPAVETLSRAVRVAVKAGSRVGLDMNRAPVTFADSLRASLNEMKLENCDELLTELRMTKTLEEVRVLADVSYRTDHGILGAVHHIIITAPRTEMSLAEEVRVHCLERGLEAVGYHSLSLMASGEHSTKFWPLPPFFGIGGGVKELKQQEIVRVEMRSSIDGYWSDAARMVVMGEPTPEQKKAYEGLVALRAAAVAAIRPGVRCNEVFEAVSEEAKKRGIDLIADLGVGHGVGVSTHEPPYLVACDTTPLSSGMILVLDPVVRGPENEIMRSKDTLLVTESGCRIMGWYKDWRVPFIPAYAL